MNEMLSSGTVHVFTYKDGVLARFAHDLRLTLARFSITLAGREVRATFDPSSLKVDGVVKGARVDAGVLSEKDRRDVMENLERHVLRWRSHPEITYAGRLTTGPGATFTLKGTLTLVGRSGPLEVKLRRHERRVVGEASLLQTRWGIQPFSAMMGAIKIKNPVDVRFEIPLPAGVADEP